jgi:predicted PurR-regulated permease PerM
MKNDDESITTTNETEGQSPYISVQIDPAWPSTGTIIRLVLVALAMIFVFNRFETIVSSLTSLFFLVILSVFFAYLLSPLVKAIRLPFKQYAIERFMPRSLAIVLSFLIVFSVIGLSVSYFAPTIVEQGKEFTDGLPTLVTRIRAASNDLGRRFDRLRLPQDVQTKLNEEADKVVDSVATFFTDVLFGGFLLNVVLFAPWLILVPILTFFFLKDVNQVRLAVLRLFPPGRWRMRAEAVMQDVNTTLAAYTRAQLISCLIIGVVCTTGFYIIGLKYALLLGILAAIFEFVPLLGPLALATIATTTAAFSDNPWKALYVAIFLLTLRLIHDYITYPRIVRGGIHLHPLVIILAVLAGEQVAGIPGVFLAIPIVALFTVIYKHTLEHRGGQRLFDGLAETDVAEETAT